MAGVGSNSDQISVTLFMNDPLQCFVIVSLYNICGTWGGGGHRIVVRAPIPDHQIVKNDRVNIYRQSPIFSLVTNIQLSSLNANMKRELMFGSFTAF